MALQGKTKNVAMFMLSMAFTALFSTGAFAYNLSAKVKDVEITDSRQEIQLQMDATGDSSGNPTARFTFSKSSLIRPILAVVPTLLPREVLGKTRSLTSPYMQVLESFVFTAPLCLQ